MRLHVRTDNVTTIALLARLKVSGRSLHTVGKEFAVLLASASFEPDVVQHTPGVQHQLAGYLSRRYESQHWSVLESLEPLVEAQETFPPRRSRDWWITLSTPSELSELPQTAMGEESSRTYQQTQVSSIA